MKNKIILKSKIAIFCLIVLTVLNILNIRPVNANIFTFDYAKPAGLSITTNDERDIFRMINKQRESRGLEGLFWDEELARLAQFYSLKMARDRFFSHYESNGSGVVERAKAMNINDWRKIGENLFTCTGYKNINKLAVEKWMASPGHRRNIMDSSYNSTGIGIAQADDGTYYITQVFVRK